MTPQHHPPSVAGGSPIAPLAGLRVVDASTFVAGPFAALLLHDLGATVIKVEPPGGDPVWRFGITHQGVSAMGFNVNRGKEVRRVDLKSTEGHDEVLGLLSDADVFLHNWRPGVAERLGLGASAICDRFPKLVYLSIMGFGPDGPRAGDPVFDSLLQAASGLAAYEGEADQPRLGRSYLADKVAGSYVSQAAMAGILERGRTGRGGRYEVSMFDAMAHFNFPDVLQHRTFEDHQPDLTDDRNRPVRTLDGWVVVAPVRGAEISAAARALGHPEWVEDLKRAPSAAASVERLLELMGPVVATMPTKRCVDDLREAGVPVMAVLTVDAHLADAQTTHNDLYRTVSSPGGPARAVRHPLRRGA